MADQASVTAKAKANGSAEGVVGSIAELGNDVATLAELQAKLAALDFRESAQRAVIPLVLALAGLVVAVSAVPVLLVGLAAVLASALSVQPGWMLLIVAGVALLGAGGVAAVAGLRFVHSFETFRRSREELVRNLSWIRTVLVYSGRPAARRR